MGKLRLASSNGKRSLTLFYEENELLGHENKGKTQEHVLLGEMGERSREYATDAMFRTQSSYI